MGSRSEWAEPFIEANKLTTCLTDRGFSRPQSGEIYEGFWRNGRRKGEGVLKRKVEGYTYSREWKKDLMHGEGKETTEQGGLLRKVKIRSEGRKREVMERWTAL